MKLLSSVRSLLAWSGLPVLIVGAALAGCIAPSSGGGPTHQPVLANPYESCDPVDSCGAGTECLSTTLPVSAGYTGYSCTNPCRVDADCLQDITNYAAICVNSQCYIQCPNGGANCPYNTGCVTLTDQAGYAIDVCTP